MDQGYAPVFIGGHSRSGTTLLAVLLDRHSQFSVPPETRIHNVLGSLLGAADGGHEALLKSWISRRRHNDFGVPVEVLKQRFLAYPCEPKYLLRSLLEIYAKRHHKRRWAEKTPGHIFHLRLIFDWFPNAKVILMQRDGRDVLRSMSSLPQRLDSLWRYGSTWRRSVRFTREAMRVWPEQVLVVRYENLLSQPEHEMARVMTFLGECFEAGQLDESVANDVVRPYESAWKEKANKRIDSSRAAAWRQALRGKELTRANAQLWPELEEEGYPEASVKGSWIERKFWALKRGLWDLLLYPWMGWVRVPLRAIRRALRALMEKSFPRKASMKL